MKLTRKEKRILATTLSIWGFIFISCGIIMKTSIKPIIKTKYEVTLKEDQLTEQQAKLVEIKLKDFEIEINSPLSVNPKDYLANQEEIEDDVIKALKLDTALVNTTQPGKYEYTITYKKKKYVGNIIVKEKELPNVQFTLKEIKIKKGEVLSGNKRDFINEEITDEVYDNMKLNINPDYSNNPGEYTYTIIYKNVTYKGKIIVEDIEEKIVAEEEKGPITVIEPSTTTPTPTKESTENTNQTNS